MVSARAAEQFPSASTLALSGEATDSLELGEIRGRDEAASLPAMDSSDEDQEPRPPYAHAMLAGGLGGLSGDMLMHSLDTVKTRQQGDPHRPPKYHSLLNTYYTIFRQEGLRRGLYGGVLPAFVGSFSGTSIFFGAYEYTKRWQIDMGIAPSIAYLNAGFLADLAASPVYVPTEVLKTRLQLQGRYNNPFFKSGYNYKSTLHAMRTIYRTEGMAALFHGYGATLWRDLPFSALQFVFYEKERQWAKSYVGSKEIGLPLEILTGATAGGLAGVITCPLDVVKTRMQTQLQPAASPPPPPAAASSAASNASPTVKTGAQKRTIFTHAPHSYKGSPTTLDTSSVTRALRIIYQTEGIAGWFRGVGPRGVWTSVQSGTMLVLYQQLLSLFDKHWDIEDS